MSTQTSVFDSYLPSFERWAECEAARMDDNDTFILSIYCDKTTLQTFYLSFQKQQKSPNLCFIQISSDIEVRVNATQMMLTFKKYNDVSVIFLVPNLQEFEMILSQFCLRINRPGPSSDQFHNSNLSFIYSIQSDKTYVSEAIKNGTFSPLQPNFAYATPIIENKHLLKLWKERIYSLNSGFVTDKAQLRVTFLTWNVASVRPNHTVLDEISRAFTNGAAKSDIIFIALQEIDMGVVSVVAGSSKKVKDLWSKIIHVAVSHQNGEFVIVAESCLGGVFAALIFRLGANPKPICGDVKTIRLGAHGFAANKGSIIFPVFAGATRFIFMGCHLTAGSNNENWEARNQQLRQLMKLVDGNYDYLAIIGDLNYRINLTYENCIECVQKNNITSLLEKDQLRITRSRDQFLARLKEPTTVNFLPTYKFDPNSDTYDTSPKHRVPSYTDRVLLKRGKKRLSVANVTSPIYEVIKPPESNFPSMPICVDFNRGTCKFSDHRSVLCAYKFDIPIVNEKKLDQLYKLTDEKIKDIAKNLTGSVEFSPNPVLVTNSQIIKINICNRKFAWAKWHIISTPEVDVSPSQGLLLPGNTEQITLKLNQPISTINLKVTVDNGDPTVIVVTTDPNTAQQPILTQNNSPSKANMQIPQIPQQPQQQQQQHIQQIQQQPQFSSQQQAFKPVIAPQQPQFSSMQMKLGQQQGQNLFFPQQNQPQQQMHNQQQQQQNPQTTNDLLIF